jgi:hypothetical protein
MPCTSHERFELEALFDKLGVEGIMSSLAEICHVDEKHVMEHWHDRGLAARWHKLGGRLEKLASELDDSHFQ